VSVYGLQDEEEIRERVSRIRHGLGLTGIGDARWLVRNESRRGNAATDRAAARVLHHHTEFATIFGALSPKGTN